MGIGEGLSEITTIATRLPKAALLSWSSAACANATARISREWDDCLIWAGVNFTSDWEVQPVVLENFPAGAQRDDVPHVLFKVFRLSVCTQRWRTSAQQKNHCNSQIWTCQLLQTNENYIQWKRFYHLLFGDLALAFSQLSSFSSQYTKHICNKYGGQWNIFPNLFPELNRSNTTREETLARPMSLILSSGSSLLKRHNNNIDRQNSTKSGFIHNRKLNSIKLRMKRVLTKGNSGKWCVSSVVCSTWCTLLSNLLACENMELQIIFRNRKPKKQ